MGNIINPYKDVNWNTAISVPSCSHDHCNNNEEFANLIAGGIKYVVVSNYYPSAPVYPLNSKFSNVPNDVLGGPNAEHHETNIDRHHFNGIGCFHTSGSPAGSTPRGFGRADWKYAYKKVLETLQYKDGGGITINHPYWSSIDEGQLTYEDIIEMLDFDDRVIGVEFYNVDADIGVGGKEEEMAIWNRVLSTGRRCWGFCVPDHYAQRTPDFGGRTILLVPEFTEHECLKAYREGRFYSKLYNTNLVFKSIAFDESTNTLSVETSNADHINVIVDNNSTRFESNLVTTTIPSDAVYFRVEAHNENDSIWSNAITLRVYKKQGGTGKKMLILE